MAKAIHQILASEVVIYPLRKTLVDFCSKAWKDVYQKRILVKQDLLTLKELSKRLLVRQQISLSAQTPVTFIMTLQRAIKRKKKHLLKGRADL